jgi:hypothetical protein
MTIEDPVMEKIIRHLKKEYLLLKRKRDANYATRRANLISVVEEKWFHITEVEVSHTFLLQNCNGSIMKSMDFGLDLVLESKALITEKIQEIKSLFCNVQELMVFPFDWELHGSLVINTQLFFDNFEDILYYLEDGVYIFDPLVNKKIRLRGERNMSSEELNYLEIAGNII